MNGQTVHNLENYQSLANGIVIKAARDYVYAWRCKKKSEIEAIERFFNGEEFELFSNVDPDYLIKNLRQMAER